MSNNQVADYLAKKTITDAMEHLKLGASNEEQTKRSVLSVIEGQPIRFHHQHLLSNFVLKLVAES